MTSIAALSVQSMTRPAAAHAAAPVAATPAREGEADGRVSARDPAPALPLLAQPSLAALVAVQAQQGGGHADPQPDHGKDDQHGHAPAPQPTPDPTPAPPPVVTPPVFRPAPVAADPAAAARAIAGVERVLAEGRIAQAERSAFAAASAERRAAATVAQGQAALAIFAAMQANMADFRARYI